jgi:hypothetical protein
MCYTLYTNLVLYRLMNMNQKRNGRKRSWPNMRYFYEIFVKGQPVSRPGLECGNSTTTTQDCCTIDHDIWSQSNVLNSSIIWCYIVYALTTLSNKPDTTKNVSGNIPKHYYYFLILFVTIPCLKKCLTVMSQLMQSTLWNFLVLRHFWSHCFH